jgi:lipopolysaccharide export system protein LptC
MTQMDVVSFSGLSDQARLFRRQQAFRDARRHSAFVKGLKFLIVMIFIAAIASFFIPLFLAPMTKPSMEFAVNQSNLNGTRITMESPKLSGFRRDGSPYEVKASSGVQDIRSPLLIELSDLAAKVGIGANDMLTFSAPKGVFDSGRDFMQMNGAGSQKNVQISSTTGFEIVLQSAEMDFKAGTVNSNDPVILSLPSGKITADKFAITGNGQIVTFEGRVISELWPDSLEGKLGTER